MLDIQTVGNEILTGSPRKFYVMCGSEYGVKSKYLGILKNHYGDSRTAETVESVLNLMSSRHLIPLKPMLYIVRYDTTFLSSLSDKTKSHIDKCKIIGTVVCLYEDSKALTKCSKYLADYTVSIDRLSEKFLDKYLRSDYHGMPDTFYAVAVKYGKNYQDCKNIAKSLSFANPDYSRFRLDIISWQLGKQSELTEESVKAAIASRNFARILNVYNAYNGDKSNLHYTVLSVLLDIEKLLSSPRANVADYIRKCNKLWSLEDVYNLFMIVYNELTRLRSVSSYSVEDSLFYVFSLVCFQPVPTLRDLK